MAKIRKAVLMIVKWSLFGMLAAVPGVLALHENIFRQLPLYCFLEEHLAAGYGRQDMETYKELMESNARYLGQKIVEENQNRVDKQEELEDKADSEEEQEITPTVPVSEPPENTVSPIPAEDSGEVENTENVQEEPQNTGEEETTTAAAQVQPMPEIDLAPEMLADYDYLMNHFFILDPNAETNTKQLNAAAFLSEDLTLPKEEKEPQILIYHSHSQEEFSDSREGKPEDTIVGVGDYLTQLLTEKYGYQVMHVTEAFDLMGGELDRSKAYDYAREWLEPVLEEHPSVEVLIDLHRDGVLEGRRLVTEINGKPTAQIMFYNGLSHTVNSGDLSYLPNPYIQDNLAFSFQLEYQAALYYPELYRGIYLAGLRYNLHLRPRALLLEAGAQTNTVQEVKNAMEPFADILDRVLTGK